MTISQLLHFEHAALENLFREQVHACRIIEQQLDEKLPPITDLERMRLRRELLKARGFALDTAIRIIQNGDSK